MANNNTSIATEATRAAAVQNTADYTDGVAAHLAGDWFKHNTLNLVNTLWPVGPGPADQPHPNHSIVDTVMLRFAAQIGDNEYVFGIPAVASGPFIGNGTFSGSPQAVAPSFALQPASGSFIVGQAVTLSVALLGTPPILVQWLKNGVTIDGATSVNFTIPTFSAADAGEYSCIATNSVGQITSNIAHVTLRSSATNTVPTRII